MDAPFSVAGVAWGWSWGAEARDVGRGQIIKDLSVMPWRIDFILRVMGSH